jgi:hypothetical protein
MSEIPAGTIDDIDLGKVRAADPARAAQIEVLGERLHTGEMTNEELLTLCQLLHDVGEMARAESLLRSNVTDGDAGHSLYVRLFGDQLERLFEGAVSRFAEQFGVELCFLRSPRYLCKEFLLRSLGTCGNCPHKLKKILSYQSSVQITYFNSEEIVADAYVIPNETALIDLSEQLLYDKGSWVVDHRVVPSE